ncbi:hypothetical protein VTL71DRAFT_11421 [Oculimacula yallundae]|uniref:DUF676 domain-containing protein n=1 Tax=Oculimacula yallundae TaxID=86028 RepID=A0ABR4CPZ2_9HELO
MGSAIKPEDIKRYEVTEVYSHPDAKVDIVLVHGLNGNPRNTWTAPNGVFWPSQLLPASLKSFQARILVYGYNADVYTFGSSKGGPSSDMIHQHAQTLLANLALERKSEEVSEHPIIWIAHSLGGILVKRALELSFDLQGNHDDDLRSIFVSTFGVIFLGTPHTGADPAKWGLILQGMVNALVPKKIFETHSQLVKTLQSNNEILQNINLRFLDLYPNRLRICMVHEGHPTDLKGTKRLIVDQTAASPQLPDVQYFGIEATHSGMCKFGSKNAPGFTNVSVTLRSWVQECPDFIQTRWDAERFLRKQKREDEIAQLQRLSGLLPGTSRMTSTPNTPEPGSVNNSMVISRSTISIAPEDPDKEEAYFIKPSGFRPNSLFVGREAEMEQVHKMLFDKKKRADGTSAVLLQSLPGGGKTHLARQYVYEHKDDFPGGIFWLRAKSETELAAGFWDIARRAALKHPIETGEVDSSEDPEQFITMVRKWLDNRHDWLMVLDGIHFTHSALRKFIPDSMNTSLIYTSTEKSVIGDHHFMNPQLIRLPLLSAREAQKLLLLELGRTEPFAKDDLRYSMELVQSMGFLPVVIHAVARRLKTTDEPLAKFAKTYSSEPRLRGLGTYIAVVEQLRSLGATEALNLINILCFFSQHIPVEMISLGLKALPSTIPVKAFEPVSGHSLNNTFKILNTFALIDRNDHDHDTAPNKDKDPSWSSHSSQSQTSKRSRDMLADNVDVIRLHSVVQGFFIDTLASSNSATSPGGPHPLSFWLDLSTRFFCQSYEMAHFRISRKTNAGLVEDYRLYEIHGNKLAEHLAKQLYKATGLSAGQKEVLREADELLTSRLLSLRAEIERRTPESSSIISAGEEKEDGVLTSIFDRTSSSSDAGPETPGNGYGGRKGIGTDVGLSTWGIETEKPHFESPVRGMQRIDGEGSGYYPLQQAPTHFPFPPLSMPEDPGYETDRDEVYAHATPSLIPTSPSPSFRGQSPRQFQRPRLNPRLKGSPLFRNLPSASTNGTRDPSLQFPSAIVPHLSYDHAQGFLQRNNGVTDSKSTSRGRRGSIIGMGKDKSMLSGQSSAEVALAHLRQKSPLSPREGGMIREMGTETQQKSKQNEKTNVSGSSRGRMLMLGRESYASPVAGIERDTTNARRADEETNAPIGVGKGSLEEQAQAQTFQRPHLSALESLQNIPLRANMPAQGPEQAIIDLPPYPYTPAPALGVEVSRDNGYLKPDSISSSGRDFGKENSYPGHQAFPPFEYSANLPRADDLTGLSPQINNQSFFPTQHRGKERDIDRLREIQSESLPASLILSRSQGTTDAHLLSLSYPGLQVPRRFSNSTSNVSSIGECRGAYFPGRPEFANLDVHRGCESLPISREGSGWDNFSADGTGHRSGSFAETEPDFGFWEAEGRWDGDEHVIEDDNGEIPFELRDGGRNERKPEGRGNRIAPIPVFSPSFDFPPALSQYPSPKSFTSYTSPYPPDNTPNPGLGGRDGGGMIGPSTSPRLGTRTSPPVPYLNPNFSPPMGFINTGQNPDPNSNLNRNTDMSAPRNLTTSPRISPRQSHQASPRTSPIIRLGGEAMNRQSSGSGSGSRRGSGSGSRLRSEIRLGSDDYHQPGNYGLAREVGEREGVLRSWGERERNERRRRDGMSGRGGGGENGNGDGDGNGSDREREGRKRGWANGRVERDVGLGIVNGSLGDVI